MDRRRNQSQDNYYIAQGHSLWAIDGGEFFAKLVIYDKGCIEKRRGSVMINMRDLKLDMT